MKGRALGALAGAYIFAGGGAGAWAAEFAVAADSLTVVNQLNVSSAAYLEGMPTTGPGSPGSPDAATSFTTPGGLYFDATEQVYKVWDRGVGAWVQVTTGTSVSDPTKVLKAGDTMTGALTLPADPTAALEAAPKQYVDSWTRSCVNPDDAGDVMVAVGDLCVDKYEASVWNAARDTQYGSASDNYLCGDDGQDCAAAGANPIYARSVSGVTPSRYLTWYQASIACRNAGKHLLTSAEWQDAAAGTSDPGAGGVSPNCITGGSGPGTTGSQTSCESSWGAQDMIGSLWEWTADWVAEPGWNGVMSTNKFNSDGYWHGGWQDSLEPARGSDGSNMTWDGAANSHEPAAVIRGGNWADGANAGVFAFSARTAPSHWADSVGFRCGRRR